MLVEWLDPRWSHTLASVLDSNVVDNNQDAVDGSNQSHSMGSLSLYW